ncbi:MAG TPA: hypothetical protein VFK27_01905, partial [Bacillales bacterium]|nr:hypothetical protein [Bacillales bacterium]
MKYNLIQYFFMIYGFVLLVTSVLLIPSIQGTTTAYLLSFIGIVLLFLINKDKQKPLIHDVIMLASIYIAILLLSQAALAIYPQLDLSGLRLIEKPNRYIFRSSII